MIQTGDARELIHGIGDESIDFILTDPEYDDIGIYHWLACQAVKVLKPDRAMLVFCSDIKMFDCKAAMEIDGLDFIKPFYYVVQAKSSCLKGYGIYTWTTPALLFVKGRGWPAARTKRRCTDTKIETVISHKKPADPYKWNKNPEVLMAWLQSFTKKGDTVLDPFAGSGSISYCCKQTERQCIAYELDPDVALYSNERLARVQMMFDLEDSRQGELFT